MLSETLRPRLGNGYGVPDDEPDVTKFPQFDFSMRDVRQAGKIIAGRLDVDDPNIDQVYWAFRVANNWRDAHAYPMRSVRQQLTSYVRTLGIDGIVVARLKRMQAIRKKLRRIGPGLNQLQDLAGCRVIVSTVTEVSLLASVLPNRSRHAFRTPNDYISHPKEKDGYRSYHLIFDFRGLGDASVFDGRRIELQVRTRLQHSWATAVEAVGLFRGEDLKGGKGDPRWLRLFKLMSAEFAYTEGCSDVPNVPTHDIRAKEIAALDRELSAADTLENLSQAVRFSESAVLSREEPLYYLVKYDNATSKVEITPLFSAINAVASYDRAERPDNESGEDKTNVVLVEASKVGLLRQAYPNYFGDVQQFKANLLRITQGKSAKDFTLIPQERVFQPRLQHGDLTWLRRRGRWND